MNTRREIHSRFTGGYWQQPLSLSSLKDYSSVTPILRRLNHPATSRQGTDCHTGGHRTSPVSHGLRSSVPLAIDVSAESPKRDDSSSPVSPYFHRTVDSMISQSRIHKLSVTSVWGVSQFANAPDELTGKHSEPSRPLVPFEVELFTAGRLNRSPHLMFDAVPHVSMRELPSPAALNELKTEVPSPDLTDGIGGLSTTDVEEARQATGLTPTTPALHTNSVRTVFRHRDGSDFPMENQSSSRSPRLSAYCMGSNVGITPRVSNWNTKPAATVEGLLQQAALELQGLSPRTSTSPRIRLHRESRHG